ncbi:MAG: protease, partial [Actinomycetota bacterium]|nr:protease [Actinomycetota bacterium]
AMATEAIVAAPGTVTGSIGVVTGKLVARELKDRLGVGSDAVRTNANADAWTANAPFTPEQRAMVEAEADLFYDDFVRRVAEARGMSVEAVDEVARGRVWTGADAHERGLVDELGGLRCAVRRAKVAAGLDADADVRLVSYPGSSMLELMRPRASSEPAAVSLPDALAGLAAQTFGRVLEGLEGVDTGAARSVSGASALWLGNYRF